MTTPTPRRADDIVAALADAFDQVAPSERSAAELELLDAGLDPSAVAARFARLGSPSPRHANGRATPPPAPPTAAPGRYRWWAIAAALLVAVGVALLGSRTPLERAVRSAAVPRAIEPPAAHPAAPAPNVAGDAHAAAASEPGARVTPMGGAPAGMAGDGPADTETVARAARELTALLQGQGPVPAIVAAGIRDGTLALREITVAAGTIANLQSAAFIAASAANAGRYEVDPALCHLRARGSGAPVSERFGYPFPTLSADSRRAGCEIMWNVEAAFAAGGGHRGRATLCTTPGAGYGESCADARFASLAFVGRQSGGIDDPSALRAASLAQVYGIPDEAGVGILMLQSLDGGDAKHWLYEASTRRVRTLGTSPLALDPPLGGLALAADDRNCFDAAPESYDWTLVRQQDVLAPLSGEGISLGDTGEAAPQASVALTVMRRPTWVVAATGRGALAGGPRMELYIDRELYRPYWRTEYVGGHAVASYACGAAWAADGDMVAPLTSSVTRFEAATGRVDRFVPYEEVLDQSLRSDDFTLRALIGPNQP